MDNVRNRKMRIEEATEGLILRVVERSDPPIDVLALRDQAAEQVSQGNHVPFVAYVSGPEINREICFVNYDAEGHKPIVAEYFMKLIRQGVERIVVVSEVWFLDDDHNREWHGVLVNESTALSDNGHCARFEGRNRLGEWQTGPAEGLGNLMNLFEQAWVAPSGKEKTA
jgi:hypothetical protein